LDKNDPAAPVSAEEPASQLWAELWTEEQLSLARDLHDQIGPAVTALGLAARLAEERGDLTALVHTVRETMAALEAWMDERRRQNQASFVSRVGLTEALHWLAARLEQSTGAVIAVADESAGARLPLATELALFGHTQEVIERYVLTSANVASIHVRATPERFSVELTIARVRNTEVPVTRFSALLPALGGSVSARTDGNARRFQASVPVSTMLPAQPRQGL
jgi:signal transduction histidine kinase